MKSIHFQICIGKKSVRNIQNSCFSPFAALFLQIQLEEFSYLKSYWENLQKFILFQRWLGTLTIHCTFDNHHLIVGLDVINLLTCCNFQVEVNFLFNIYVCKYKTINCSSWEKIVQMSAIFVTKVSRNFNWFSIPYLECHVARLFKFNQGQLLV